MSKTQKKTSFLETPNPKAMTPNLETQTQIKSHFETNPKTQNKNLLFRNTEPKSNFIFQTPSLNSKPINTTINNTRNPAAMVAESATINSKPNNIWRCFVFSNSVERSGGSGG
ncbi:hypothetical protein ACB092_01G122400 [Castanea dentata]